MTIPALNSEVSSKSPDATHADIRRGPFAGTYRTIFATSVSLLLLFTAIAKIVAIVQPRSYLALSDPVISSITTRQSMLVAIILEMSVAVFVFVRRKRLSAMVGCSWLVSIFVGYRMLAYALFTKKLCPCMGGVLDWTRLPQALLDIIPIIILCYIGIGSMIFLLLSNIENSINDSEI